MKKLELKPFLISIGLILSQTVFFFLTKLLQSDYHIIGNAIDQKIQFNSLAIIPYYIWYILLLVVPYYLYRKDKEMLCKFIASYILCVFISSIIFVCYPTTVLRPEIKPDSLLNFMTWFIYKADTPAVNCLPSLHCAISMLFTLSAFCSKNVSLKFKITIAILSILVMISTLVIKQHVFIDLVTGDVLMTICFLLMYNNQFVLSKIKKLLKI